MIYRHQRNSDMSWGYVIAGLIGGAIGVIFIVVRELIT